MKAFQFIRQIMVEAPGGGFRPQGTDAFIEHDGVRHNGIPVPMLDLGDGITASPQVRAAVVNGKPGAFIDFTHWGFADQRFRLKLPLVMTDCADPIAESAELIGRYKAQARGQGAQHAFDWMLSEAQKLPAPVDASQVG